MAFSSINGHFNQLTKDGQLPWPVILQIIKTAMKGGLI